MSVLRRTGIDAVGNVPWGTHFCQFYRTKEDLVEILVPYFKAGLDNNELCVWITSEPLRVEEAERALGRAVKNLSKYREKRQIDILDHSQWYTVSGQFEGLAVWQSWLKRETQALQSGFDGLRIAGNASWLEKREWKNFADYEAIGDGSIGKHRIVCLCSYSLDRCEAYEVIDVVNNHQFALIKQGGRWVSVESAQRRTAEQELERRNLQLGALNALAESLSRSTKSGEVLQGTLRSVIDTMGLSAGVLHVLDKANGELILAASRGRRGRPAAEFMHAFVKTLQTLGIVSLAMKTGEVVSTANVPRAERVDMGVEVPDESAKMQMVVTVPLKSRGTTVGAISGVTNYLKNISAQDIYFLETIGGMAGIAIDCAQLFENMNRL